MWQPVFMISGYFISVLGVTMLFPGALDMLENGSDWSYFVSAAIICVFIGLSLFLANNTKVKDVSVQQAYLLTFISWFAVAVLAAMPFILYGSSIPDALFEAASGISTTGATVYADVEALPRSVLLWRALLNGLGGIGIVIFAIALMPFLGIGGMQIFQRENSDVNEKFLPKISYIAKRIILVYGILNVLCISALHYAGMDWFDAIAHGLSTIATGGLSTKNASIGYYNSASIDWIVTFFMILGAIPLTLYHSLWTTKDFHSLRAEQVKSFLKVLSVYVLFMSCWLTWNGYYTFGEALRYAAFNVTSIVTSTGFTSTDYMQWGAFVGSFFILFALTGGCTGSTSGSIKIFRWQVLWAYVKRSFMLITEPNRIVTMKIGHSLLSNQVVASVLVFFVAYLFSVMVLTLLVALTGEDFEVSFSAVVACITNSGPGIGPIVGPAGNYGSLADTAKLVLAFAMLLGRLEVLTVLLVFTRGFWKK